MALPVYSSRDVKVAWSGAAIDGLAPDSFVTFSRNSDLTDEEVGADGLLSISRLPDRTGTCTISLQQSSFGNALLSEVMSRQESSQKFARGSITITDRSGSILANLTGAHLKQAPEVSLGSSANGQTRDWVFFCESMVFTSNPEGLPTDVKGIIDAAVSGAVDTIMDSAFDVLEAQIRI